MAKSAPLVLRVGVHPRGEQGQGLLAPGPPSRRPSRAGAAGAASSGKAARPSLRIATACSCLLRPDERVAEERVEHGAADLADEGRLPGPDRVEVLAARGVARPHVDRRREELRVEPQRRLELRQGGGQVAARVVGHPAQEGRAGVVLRAPSPSRSSMASGRPCRASSIAAATPAGTGPGTSAPSRSMKWPERLRRQQLGPVEGPRLDEQAGERGARRRRSRPAAGRRGTAASRPPPASRRRETSARAA